LGKVFSRRWDAFSGNEAHRLPQSFLGLLFFFLGKQSSIFFFHLRVTMSVFDGVAWLSLASVCDRSKHALCRLLNPGQVFFFLRGGETVFPAREASLREPDLRIPDAWIAFSASNSCLFLLRRKRLFRGGRPRDVKTGTSGRRPAFFYLAGENPLPHPFLLFLDPILLPSCHHDVARLSLFLPHREAFPLN